MTIELSKETQQSLQAYLAERGLAEEAMSDVVDEAVETFLFRQVFREAHECNAEVDPENAEAAIEEAVRDYRRGQTNR
ncbi:hypothetical protein BH24DEI2_BH24DEI2_22930 [soil metagenome]